MTDGLRHTSDILWDAASEEPKFSGCIFSCSQGDLIPNDFRLGDSFGLRFGSYSAKISRRDFLDGDTDKRLSLPTFLEQKIRNRFIINFHDMSERTKKPTPTIRHSTAKTPVSLLIAFRCLLQPPGYPKRDKQEPLPYWVNVQASLILYLSHRSYCNFCHALAHIAVMDCL